MNKRINQLILVLQYDSQIERHFTDFDRMFIQKERSADLQGIPYQMNKNTEERIQHVLKIIKQIKWKPQEL